MLERIKTAFILIPLLLILIWPGGEAGTALAVFVAAIIGMKEFTALFDVKPGSMESIFTPLWAGMIAASFYFGLAAPLALLSVGLIVLTAGISLNEGPTEATLVNIGRSLAGWCYVSLPLGLAVTIRGYGFEPLLFLIILLVVSDSGAYFVGTAIGRHPLAPKVSPKKSIEGSLGGLLLSMVAGYLFARLLEVPHAPFASIFIAGLVNVAAQVGDLAESLLKRGAGVKDSGTIFPGHGGMLDRVDSFITTIPLYAFILSIIGG
ncbi:MAG: hypothetical protein C0609_00880 [Deltaproteobacteria bacterium]|nr:MAG: hypothetical protein C0609_00880 [Deltaproteobacteria bacterium]